MAKATRRRPGKGGKRRTRRQRGGDPINCANAKAINQTALQQLKYAREAARAADKRAFAARAKARTAMEQAHGTGGPLESSISATLTALDGSITAMKDVNGYLSSAELQFAAVNDCSFGTVETPGRDNPNIVSVLPPPAKRRGFFSRLFGW